MRRGSEEYRKEPVSANPRHGSTLQLHLFWQLSTKERPKSETAKVFGHYLQNTDQGSVAGKFCGAPASEGLVVSSLC